ncbi:hypothetical protein [Paenibacillus donghaensis]|uniref:Uncharacterized protein n=1 Tax=Paenibacillus donghaensis TaxID=414771 RepID=A0A2Z2K7Y8_9BACL|nr:hypothetical protein [Paenibacillus donghaensis]ASA22676.1 hypothetical protein B9T62_18895 [Paenibacillus donghaensis]
MQYVTLVYYQTDTTHSEVKGVFTLEKLAQQYIEKELEKFGEDKEMMREYFFSELRQVDYYI